MKRTATTWFPALVCAVVSCAGIASAQSTAGTGSIGGTVWDNYGDGLPDTKVTVSNKSLSLSRDVGTTDDGVFEVPGIVPASGYKLVIGRDGFREWESPEFAVAIGQKINFRVHLQPDTASEQSTGAISYSEDTRVGISSPVGALQIDSLPVSARRMDTLVPAVVPTITTDSSANYVAVLGQAFSNALLTDGILVSDGYYERLSLTTGPSLNAIQGFEVLAADAPAEFGHSMGGIVNSGTRSGSTTWHGSGYEYMRTPGLTARGRYTDGQTLMHAKNDSGLNVSGPVLKDRIFFFANAEVTNDHYEGINRITNQAIADPTGTTVLAANCKATAAQCTAVEKYLQAEMNVLVPLASRSLDGLARLDYKLSKSNAVSLSGNLTNALAPNGLLVAAAQSNGGLLGIRNTREDSRFGAASVTTQLGVDAANQLRFGEWQDHLFEPSSVSKVSTGLAEITVAGVSVGNATPNSSLLQERRYQLVDNFTGSMGSHSIQLGFDASTTSFGLNSLASAPQFTYASLTNFATDLSTNGKNYTDLNQTLGQPNPHFPMTDIDVYGQDTWRVFENLIVTVGVRWDKPLLPKTSGDNPIYYQTASIPSVSIDVAPRVGIAYRLNDKTAVRIGFGWYFAPFTGELLGALYSGNALLRTNIALSPSFTGAPFFPGGIASFSAIPSGSTEVEYPIGKLRNPKSQQTSFAVDRQLDRNTSLSVSAIDSRGFKLWTANDDNAGSPTKSITYTIDNAAGTSAGSFLLPVVTARANTAFSHAYDIVNGGTSRYDAATVEIRRRMAHGITAQASYTWSHSIDDVSGLIIPGGVPLVDQNVAFGSNRGSSQFDQRQRLVVNAVWQPVFTADKSLFARYVVNGWQLSPILTLGSGHPVTPTISASELALSGVTPLFPYTIDGSGGTSRVPFLPVDDYHTGTEHNLDVRLSRALPFTERIHATLMFDFFNALNSQWITAVNSVAYLATAGVLKPVPGAGTGSAAVSYPYGTNARGAQASIRITF